MPLRSVTQAVKQAFLNAMAKARLKALVRVPDMIQSSLDTYKERSRMRKLEVITRMRNEAAVEIQVRLPPPRAPPRLPTRPPNHETVTSVFV